MSAKHADVQLTEMSHLREEEKDEATSIPSDVLPARSWPRQPVPLIPEKRVSRLLNAFDAILIFTAILLIAKVALIVAAWTIDHKYTSSEVDMVSYLSKFLVRFNAQMVTAFTIIFVTIVSTLVKRYALYKAERGAYVAELEQLQGSVSLPSTIRLIWSLNAVSTVSIGLVSIWCFYYLGSQASQREYVLVTSDSFKKINIGLPSPERRSVFDSRWTPPADKQVQLKISDLNANYEYAAASYTDANKLVETGSDTQGNPLIPDLKYLETVPLDPSDTQYKDSKKLKIGHEGWMDVSAQSLVSYRQAYTAMAGVQPYTMAPGTDLFAYYGHFVGKYIFHTAYLDFDCGPPQLQPFEAFPNGTSSTQATSINTTVPREDAAKDAAGNTQREIEIWSRWTETDVYPGLQNGSAVFTCGVLRINVDVKVHCTDNGCITQKIRYAGNKSLANATTFSTAFDDDAFTANFTSNLLLAEGQQADLSSPTNIGISLGAGTAASLFGQNMSQAEVNTTWSTIAYGSSAKLGSEQEMKRVINTYYLVAQTVIESQDPPNIPLLASQPSDGNGYVHAVLHGAIYNPHYEVFWEWIAIDFVSCFILLGAAIASTWLRRRTLAPDIFGYVSSLTRDNPHLDLPNNGTTLGGIERAAMLKKVKVRIGDVSAPDEPNRVGLARVDSGVGRSQRHVEQLRRTAEYL